MEHIKLKLGGISNGFREIVDVETEGKLFYELAQTTERAKHIVKCCNSHDGLVGALRPLKTAYTEPLRGTNSKVVGYNIKIDVKQHKAILQALAENDEPKVLSPEDAHGIAATMQDDEV